MVWNNKHEIIALCKQIIAFKDDNPYQKRHYQKLLKAIETYETPLTEGISQFERDGIGNENILRYFYEFELKGTVDFIEKKIADPVTIAIKELTRVHGIGKVEATKLYQKYKVVTIPQLRNLVQSNTIQLSHAQSLGLFWLEHIEQRIPREIIIQYENVFQNMALQLNISCVVCGSYRRHAYHSGDIDLLLYSNSNANISSAYKQFVDECIHKKIFVGILSRGEYKTMAIGFMPMLETTHKTAVRVDVICCTKTELPFALLYFTGSAIFNTLMRQRAIDMGLKLDEHRIVITNPTLANSFRIQSIPNLNSEHDIFQFLHIEWREPHERTDNPGAFKIVYPKEQAKLTQVADSLWQAKQTNEKPNPIHQSNSTFQLKDLKDHGDNASTAKKSLKKLTLSKNKNKNKTRSNHKSEQSQSYDHMKASYIKAKDAYYNTGNSILSDHAFDALESKIKEKEAQLHIQPSQSVTCSIGSQVPVATSDSTKVTLPVFMASLDKKKTEKEVLGFIGKHTNTGCTSAIIMPKLDGVSALLIHQNQNTWKLFTRGDGSVGQDISHLLNKISPIQFLKEQHMLHTNIMIRGELILPIKTFEEKYAGTFKNPRNLVSGIVNSKKMDTIHPAVSDVQFIGYELIFGNTKDTNADEMLLSEIFDKVLSKIIHCTNIVPNAKYPISTINETFLLKMLQQYSKRLPYQTDGVVVAMDYLQSKQQLLSAKKTTSGRLQNPKFMFAFKPSSEASFTKTETNGGITSEQTKDKLDASNDKNTPMEPGITKVTQITWEPSVTGKLVPVVHFDPVQLDGSSIEKATGHNASNILSKKIAKNTIIKIIRSGQVIPKIESVIKTDPLLTSNDILPPSSLHGFWNWNSSQVDIYLAHPNDNKIVQLKRIVAFFKGIHLKGMSDGIVQRLMNHNFDSIRKILCADVNQIQTVPGFAQKSALKLHTAIHQAIKSVDNTTLVHACVLAGTLGSEASIGMDAIQKIMSKDPSLLLSLTKSVDPSVFKPYVGPKASLVLANHAYLIPSFFTENNLMQYIASY